MALPMILSLLGSGLAGAGALGAMSPLIAGAIGSGLGSAIETGDLKEGIKSGLFSGLLGGIGGSLTGKVGEEAGKGMLGGLAGLPSGMEAVANPVMAQGGAGMSEIFKGGLTSGALTGAGLGTALGGAMMTQPPRFGEEQYPDIPEATPANRQRMAPPAGYMPGVSPEFAYYSPSIIGAQRFAGGGQVKYIPAGMEPIPLQAGGLADMAMAENMLSPAAGGEMNDKEIVSAAIRAVRNELPEQEAAMVLAKFVQVFGENALRRLVDDVMSGRAEDMGGDVEGTVKGPGDGMDDIVPGRAEDQDQDYLLSNDEFVVPADVVSGLGNGSSEAGAEELDKMMDRVRRERTGMKEQPKKISAGAMLPA